MTASKPLEEEPYVWSKRLERDEDGLVRGSAEFGFICWYPGRGVYKDGDAQEVCLDGDFTIRDLEAIIAHMRKFEDHVYPPSPEPEEPKDFPSAVKQFGGGTVYLDGIDIPDLGEGKWKFWDCLLGCVAENDAHEVYYRINVPPNGENSKWEKGAPLPDDFWPSLASVPSASQASAPWTLE